MVLLIDNYDSFSYNLYQMVGMLEPDIRVIRNDEMTVEEIEALNPERIILSPGPGKPQDAGICEEVVRGLGSKIPILGVCLGHQAICEVYGAKVGHASHLMHGKQSQAAIDTNSKLFSGMNSEIKVARYHSLAVERNLADGNEIAEDLIITATSEDGEVMAVEHRDYPVYGVQFHPESIMTPDGIDIIRNFIMN